MNLAITVDQGRITSLYLGVHIMLVVIKNQTYECRIVNTDNWSKLSWGKKLLYYDVDLLICSGIEQFLYGVIKGYGINVIPYAIGSVLEVLEHWREGELQPPGLWPQY